MLAKLLASGATTITSAFAFVAVTIAALVEVPRHAGLEGVLKI